MTGKFKSMSRTKKILLGVGAFTVLSVIAGALSPPPPKTDDQKTPASNMTAHIGNESADAQEQAPKSEIKSVEEVVDIPFQSSTQNDASLEAGKTTVSTAGVTGKKTITYEITLLNGTETSRKQISERVTQPPIDEVTKIGTRPKVAPKPQAAAKCDKNYSGCVPIASDVDCAGGSGNGPAYVQGPIRVVGVDVYDLDRDGNGIACE